MPKSLKKQKKKKILLVAGARPNFMKIGPLAKALKRIPSKARPLIVHTGQHYDDKMSDIFFRELRMPKPDIYLNVGSASHAVQTAKIMTAFEEVLHKEKPDTVVVVGDVNSTMACSLVASKLHIPVAHVESGLRSFDRKMPEEINRLVTDSISDYLFVSEPSGLKNLRKEGISAKKIHFVGNIMIDSLRSHLPVIRRSGILRRFKLTAKKYAVITLHRPSNVDNKNSIAKIYDIFKSIPSDFDLVYPIHPRTKKMIEKHGFLKRFKQMKNLRLIEPLGYIDFNQLVRNAKFVLTDSGGIQEETTVMGVPCLTMRENTERPVTLQQGSNILVGTNKPKILRSIRSIMNGGTKKSRIPKGWDGKTAARIARILTK